ncbi:MAG: hypothetical protein K1W15_12225 [Lachnospiraceae bacterium]
MEIENILSENITAAGSKADYDAACKRLLSNKIILAWIMKSCIEEYSSYEVYEIAGKYIEGTPQVSETAVNPDEGDLYGYVQGTATEDSTITEGSVTYDIRFYAIIPGTEEKISLIINIEAQNDFYPGYPIIKRAIYYCSRMVSSQYGREFTNSHYEKIKKVYSVWICTKPPVYRQNTINRYTIHEENLAGDAREKKENYDLMAAIIICLGSPCKDRYSGILKLLEVLLSSERKPEEKKQILKEDFNIKMTSELESEVALMCNLSKGIEEKGINQGIKEGIITAIKNLMESMDWTEEQAMEALKIPEADKPLYSSMLER